MRSCCLLLAMLSALLLSACDATPPAPAPILRVEQAMGGLPDPGFARALEVREFQFPQDHGAHPDFATEWWYLTGNLSAENVARFGYQLTLFRVGLRPGEVTRDSDWRSNQVYMGHLAISDIAGGRHYSAERFARAAAGLAGARVAPFEIWLGPWSLHGDKPCFPCAWRHNTKTSVCPCNCSQAASPWCCRVNAACHVKAPHPVMPRTTIPLRVCRHTASCASVIRFTACRAIRGWTVSGPVPRSTRTRPAGTGLRCNWKTAAN